MCETSRAVRAALCQRPSPLRAPLKAQSAFCPGVTSTGARLYRCDFRRHHDTLVLKVEVMRAPRQPGASASSQRGKVAGGGVATAAARAKLRRGAGRTVIGSTYSGPSRPASVAGMARREPAAALPVEGLRGLGLGARPQREDEAQLPAQRQRGRLAARREVARQQELEARLTGEGETRPTPRPPRTERPLATRLASRTAAAATSTDSTCGAKGPGRAGRGVKPLLRRCGSGEGAVRERCEGGVVWEQRVEAGRFGKLSGVGRRGVWGSSVCARRPPCDSSARRCRPPLCV